MPKYAVEVTETLKQTIEVEAPDFAHAKDAAESQYWADVGNMMLNPENISGAMFDVVSQVPEQGLGKNPNTLDVLMLEPMKMPYVISIPSTDEIAMGDGIVAALGTANYDFAGGSLAVDNMCILYNAEGDDDVRENQYSKYDGKNFAYSYGVISPAGEFVSRDSELPFNRPVPNEYDTFTHKTEKIEDLFAGKMIVCGTTKKGYGYCSITAEQISKLRKDFPELYYPQKYVLLGGEIRSVKLNLKELQQANEHTEKAVNLEGKEKTEQSEKPKSKAKHHDDMER